VRRDQRGVTLVELLIAVAVTGIIISVLAPLLYQVLRVTGYGSDKLVAAHELQHVGQWLTQDVRTASNATGGSGELTLVLPDTSQISYVLVSNDFYRITAADTLRLAGNIAAAEFSVGGDVVTADIMAAPPGRWAVSENMTYIINLRPSG